jgi:predicted anti-sigma-YlaC factor YlaD
MNMSDRSAICAYRGRLEAFWDGEVSSEERQRVEAHLRECASCRQGLQELQSLAGALKVYHPPVSGWSSDARFWQTLAPQLHPRAIPVQEGRTAQPSAFLAPVSLMVSSIALRGLAALALVAYALCQWQLLPASLSEALAAATRLVVGPLVWDTGKFLYTNLATALPPFLATPGQVWYLAVEATTAAMLLLLAGLYIGWLLRWLRNQGTMQTTTWTE